MKKGFLKVVVNAMAATTVIFVAPEGFFFGGVALFLLLTSWWGLGHQQWSWGRPIRQVRFFGFFAMEMVRANIAVARIVLTRPRNTIRSRYVDINVHGLSLNQKVLMAHLITLAPGTVVVSLDTPFDHMILHLLDSGEMEIVAHLIEREMKKHLMEVAR